VNHESIRPALKKAPARRGSPRYSPDALQQGLDRARQRFVATFVTQCDSIGDLVDKVAALGPKGPVAALTQIAHRLSGLAGTIGFPTISARASALEDLVGGASRGVFDALRVREAVDAIRSAFAEDLARRQVRPPPKASPARGSKPIVAADGSADGSDEDGSNQKAIETTAPRGPGLVPAIRVLIVDDHAIVRRGLRAVLSEEFSGAAFGEASNARQALEQLRNKKWDVALLDITMPGKSGLDLLKELKAEWPRLPVLVLSGHTEDQFAVRVLKAGAGGYMTKESAPEELAKAVRRILAGGQYVSPALAEKLASRVQKDLTRTPHETLSDREYDVMARIGSGKTVTEIAEELSLSAKTISTYRARVLEKLDVKNSAEIAQYALRNGLVI
jgi:two-component system, NarL family, invasion response regulator UvrY